MNKRIALALAAAAMLVLSACEQPAPPAPVASPPQVVTVTIAADGTVTFNGEVIARQDLEARFEALKQTGSEVHLAPEKDASYKTISAVMKLAMDKGLTKWGVIGGT